MNSLKSFPRGGKKPLVKKFSDALFDSKHKPKRKRKSQIIKEDNNITSNGRNLIATTAERLSNATLCEGMIILGQISKITEYELIVSIPGGLLGRVQITDISESYTNLLQNIISSQNVQSSEFKTLSDLYNPGDYVVCYVKNINPEGRWMYNLSLEPQLINQNIDNSYLVKDMKIICTVKSIEDHGYIVDTGIANVRAFVASKTVDKEKQYFPGNQMFGIIKEIKTIDQTSVITLSVKKKIFNNISTHDIKSLDALIPGIRLLLSITKVLSNGLQVTFGKNNIGYINQIYLNNPLSTYIENMEVTGTLLYIVPTVKLTYFSLLTDNPEKEKLDVGHIIQKAKVLYRESNGIVFELHKAGTRGFISLRRTNVPVVDIPSTFKQNSIHKCRILSYNWMEHLYVCTMEKNILEQPYFTCSDLNFGDILTVKVTNIDRNSSFLHVQIGKIRGIVAPEHISDNGLSALNKIKVGDNIEARVLHIDNDKRNIKFTLKQSLIKSMLPILYDIHKAQCGSKYHGTITKIDKNGLLVRFYGDIKGWLPHTMLDSNTSDMNWNYSIGQTITVCIDWVDEDKDKIKLKIATNEQKQQLVKFSIGNLIEGTIIESSVEGIYVRINQTDKDVVTAFLPANHMSPCVEIGSLLASKCIPGDVISAFVFAVQPTIILSRTFVTEEQHRTFDSLKVGDSIPCSIKDISLNGVRVILPIEDYPTFGFVSYKNITNFELLRSNQICFVKITAINTREKQLSLTMTLKDVWENRLEHGIKMITAVDVLNLYFNKLAELAANTFYKDKPISSIMLGQKVTGNVKKITEDGLVLQLENNLIGTVRKDHYTGNFKIGDRVYGTILWKNYVYDIVDVSLLPRIINGISSKQKALPHLPTATVLRGEILIITNWFILVLIKYHGVGYLAALPVRRHVNDISPDLTPYMIHANIRLYVVMKTNESGILPICMLKSAFEIPTMTRILKRKMTYAQDGVIDLTSLLKKLKTEKNNAANGNKIAIQSYKSNNTERKGNMKKSKMNKNKDITEKEENTIKDIDDNNYSETDEDFYDKNDVKDTSLIMEKTHIPVCGFYWDNKSNSIASPSIETSSEEEEEESKEIKGKKKKLSAAERREQERQKEREIRQREEALADGQVPNSIDKFDKLVLSSPDSSLVWIQYMAYHIQITEIEKARAVARRAVKTINFREENERLNVWNAWLNLESKFGTFESLNDVFHEAVKANDALSIYTHMLTVHVDAGRQVELEKLIGTIIGKFKENSQIWIDCGAALLKIGLKERSRHIMQRALQSLPASKHINLMVRFANLENKLGDKDRSQTLFEQILSSYPKRVDVWSSYVDSLIKSEDIDIARRVLERATMQTLPARKMKTLFKKFISFEEKYGTPKSVEQIQQMVADYVEKQCNRESM